jgi:tryptophanase
MLTREEREKKIAEAYYNEFNLHSRDVYIDLMTDSGTNAQSQFQWSAIMQADESYAGAASYYRVLDAGKDIFNYPYIQPVHQGRAAEKVVMPLLVSRGKFSISNMFFDTTRAHVVLAGGRPLDCVVQEAKDPGHRAPFKGNMDVQKLEDIIKEYGPDKIGLVVMTVTNNSAGGQPVSMKNMKETAAVCKKYGIPLDIDAARYAENAYFIKRDEPEYRDASIRDIVKEFFSYADMFTMSAKKDSIVNMGGMIGVKDPNNPIISRIKENCISYEGFITYGGLSGRDLEALATGLYEGLNYDQLRYRVGQMEYLASILDDNGIPYQAPVGGHAVFVDARAMFPHIPYYEFPAQTLAIEMYREAGVRCGDIGSFMLDPDPDTGEQIQATFEFTRLCVPRRVYTQAHLDVVAEALINIKKRARDIRHGYKITWQPKILRHFQAHLEPIV